MRGMKRIADSITKGMRGAQLNASQPRGESCTTKLIIRSDDAQIKIEVTPAPRGCVEEPAVKRVSPKGRRAIRVRRNAGRAFCGSLRR